MFSGVSSQHVLSLALVSRCASVRQRNSTCCAFFVRHADKVLTARQILTDVWGPAHATDAEYLRGYIGQLRRRLHATREDPIIATEQGVGYPLRLT